MADAELNGIEGYYRARVKDLKLFSEHGTPWEFIGGAMLIEWLANLSVDKKLRFKPPQIQRPFFIDLVAARMPNYATFEYQSPLASLEDPKQSTTRYLPLQLYLALRNPLVHSFSMIPEIAPEGYKPPKNPKSYKELARFRPIVIGHRADGENRWNGDHLALVEGDSCQLLSPNFLEDIDDLISSLFESARSQPELKERIELRFNQRRPIDSLGALQLLRRGPITA